MGNNIYKNMAEWKKLEKAVSGVEDKEERLKILGREVVRKNKNDAKRHRSRR